MDAMSDGADEYSEGNDTLAKQQKMKTSIGSSQCPKFDVMQWFPTLSNSRQEPEVL